MKITWGGGTIPFVPKKEYSYPKLVVQVNT